MSRRRDFLIGAACLGGAAATVALSPHRHVSLLPSGQTVDRIVPRAFGGWISQDMSDLVAPKVEGSLASRLYGETVGRLYTGPRPGLDVMMLLAHGDTQSDDLQLHRPEVCYPAFGFAISDNGAFDLPLAAGVSLPSRHLIAEASDRRETIVYWTRLGEYLPRDHKEQQIDRLKTALKGVVADGLLARFSIVGADSAASLIVLSQFVPALVRAVAERSRDVLIGSQRAAALVQSGERT